MEELEASRLFGEIDGLDLLGRAVEKELLRGVESQLFFHCCGEILELWGRRLGRVSGFGS